MFVRSWIGLGLAREIVFLPLQHDPMISAPTLFVDSDAIAANWLLLDSWHRAAGGRACGAAVKADAYGVGLNLAAPVLFEVGCRHFFTATIDEAIVLRKLLPEAWISVLNGLTPALAEKNIVPVLNSLGDIERWRRFAYEAEEQVSAVLHVDTGMARLGLDAREFLHLAAHPELLSGISLDFVMTHLVAAEVPQAAQNTDQTVRFRTIEATFPGTRTSLANSAGIFLGARFVSDLARPGYALYGGNPTPGHKNPMRSVIRLAAPVIQVRDIPVGASVGYNATWVATRKTRVATLGIGYADGILRAASGRLVARHRGVRIKQIGRISMDLMTFDVTEHPDIGPGSILNLLDDTITIETMAKAAETSGYEILTSLGKRYRRVLEHGYRGA